MSRYYATIKWSRNKQDFLSLKYSRAHIWKFDGGLKIPASPSPHIVRPPMSVEENIDPEEAFVASLSSCHMLFFLQLAAEQKLIIDSYIDHATGIMDKNIEGQFAIVKVILNPKIRLSGTQIPDQENFDQLHHRAHKNCFIANSVKTVIEINNEVLPSAAQ